MKAAYIINEIELHAPKSLMMDFDFAGLNFGDENQEVDSVLLCENVTIDVLKEAKENNCQMIISHHPAIWEEGEDKLTKDIIKFAKKENLVLYSAHTNLDAAKDGINDRLCNKLNIKVQSGENSCYRIGTFVKEDTLFNKKEEIAISLNDKNIRTVGDLNKQIKTVCVSCGAGARDDELVEMLNKEKIDLLIGGENKLSLAIKMRYYNICLIEVGHYNSEIICMEIFEDWLKELGIKTIKSKKDINPYN